MTLPLAFKSRPEKEGIKTRRLGSFASLLRGFKSRPEKEGIKTSLVPQGAAVNGLFKSRPEKEGIKTRYSMRDFSEGLRSKADLKKKGLRPLSAQLSTGARPFKSRPEKEGIKTGAQHFQHARGQFKSRPEKEGIKT